MIRSLASAIVVSLLLVGGAGAPARADDDASRVSLPLTIEKVWFRSGGKKREGDLIVTEDGVEFTGPKRAFSIPLERIRVVSFGTIKGDVDTKWAVMSVGVTPPYDLVGIRDGTKWGFGGRTREIFNKLRRVFEQLSAAQYGVPPGFVPYEDPDRTCTVAIPEGWHSYLASLVLVAGRTARGTTILSERPIRSIDNEDAGATRAVDDLELLDAILAGESPALFIERDQSARGMGCRGFSKSARESVLERARNDLVFGEEYEVLQTPEASEVPVGDCDGLHVVGRSRRPDGAEIVLELFAASRNGTLYMFGTRALAEHHEQYRKPLLSAVDSVTFGVALP